MAIGLKVWIYEVQGLYCSENKGADQLCGDGTAGLCLCCRICKQQVSLDLAQIRQYAEETVCISHAPVVRCDTLQHLKPRMILNNRSGERCWSRLQPRFREFVGSIRASGKFINVERMSTEYWLTA